MNRKERRMRERQANAPQLLRKVAREALQANGRETSSDAVARIVRGLRRQMRER